MIGPHTRLRLAVVPLARIVVTEIQPRYPERVLHYVTLLRDPQQTDAYAGVVSLAFHDMTFHSGLPLYTLLDGHHRYCAAILTGRSTLLALLHLEPGQPGYDRIGCLTNDLEALDLLEESATHAEPAEPAEPVGRMEEEIPA